MYDLNADKEVQEVIKEGVTAHIRLEKATQKGRYDRIDADIYRAIKVVEELNKEGHNILRLDLAEKENKDIVEDLRKMSKKNKCDST